MRSPESPCSAPTLAPPSPSSASAALPVASRLRSGGGGRGGDGDVPTTSSACHGRRTCEEESIPLRSVEAARFRAPQPANLATPSRSMVYTHVSPPPPPPQTPISDPFY
ncbi:Os10g0381800 [Oryza sativa Japonica Group]|uniref:Os10g0381800 protein n=1 Tax=Oryza sativa subsp. japonica TaxID=39947 RepID=A0A0P0XTU5_ORYSJ|nr:Os10g0381800 [Oryza sativa Japonica Group]